MEFKSVKGNYYAKGLHIFSTERTAPIGQAFVQHNWDQKTGKSIEDVEALATAKLMSASKDLIESLNEINNWLVCAAIATPEDMAQSFQYMQQVAQTAIDKAL